MQRFRRARRPLFESDYSLARWLFTVILYCQDRRKKLFLIFREDLDDVSIGLTVSQVENVGPRRQDLSRHFDWPTKRQNRLLIPFVCPRGRRQPSGAAQEQSQECELQLLSHMFPFWIWIQSRSTLTRARA